VIGGLKYDGCLLCMSNTRRRPDSKRLAKAKERFNAALTDYIISKGAVPGRFYDYEIDTPAGLLYISVNDTWIATRFDDVEAGKAFTSTIGSRCNPYSGKWNFHFDASAESLEPKAVIAYFGHFFERLLNWQPDCETTVVTK
jgi:hypothetical protein